MGLSSPSTPATIEELGAKSGLDLAKLKADMETQEIAQSLTRNYALAVAMGTLTFVIVGEGGGSLARGVGCGEVREFNRPSRGRKADAQPPATN